MKLLTDETRIRRRKRRRQSYTIWIFAIILVVPFALLIVLISNHDSENDENGRRHPVSPARLQRASRSIHHHSTQRKQEERSVRNNLRPRHDHQDGPLTAFNHIIPSNLIFTHSTNLLTATALDGEDVALKRNVENTIGLHSNATVYFWTDDDCLESIARVMGRDSPLLEFFRQESHGMFKADMCRGAALYELGGYYMDVDLEARMNVMHVIGEDTTFCTALVHRDSNHRGNFFQAFIGSTAGNPILHRYLELFEMHYHGVLDIEGPLGVILLRRAHDDVVGSREHPKPHNENVELWLEVKYHPQLFPNVPAPDWGARRACHFVIVANPDPPYTVPFYSRTRGSRMCGGSESEKE